MINQTAENKLMINLSRQFYLLLIIILSAYGCTKAKPAPIAGFVDPNRMAVVRDIPFHRMWKDPDFNYRNYTEIYIATVNTNYLLEMDWWEEFGHGLFLEEDLEYLAEFTRDELKRAFRLTSKGKLNLVEHPGKDTLILEFALIEIVPNKAVLETLSYGTIPLGASISLGANVLRMTSKSSVAFEARLRDGADGKIVAMYSDRELEKGSVINVKNFSWYGHAKSIIHEWSGQLVQVITKSHREVIPDSPSWQWKPW